MSQGRGRRSGHTLAELMVVLFILVLFAVLVGPRVLTSLYPAQLDSALSAVRNDLDFARGRTSSTGMRHQFAITAESGEIAVGPVRLDEMMTGTGPVTDVPDTALRNRLPEEVKVVEWSVTPLATGAVQGAGAGVQVVDVLTFYPEGVSDSAMLVLEDATGNRRGLELNGYTGELRELTQEELPAR